MRTFRKYEFADKAAADTKIVALGQDSEGLPTHNHIVAPLGGIVTTPPVIADDGTVTTAAVYSSNYHVDVLWDGDPDSSWDNEMVWCKGVGVHSFGSSNAEAEFMTACKEANPSWFTEPSDDDGGL